MPDREERHLLSEDLGSGEPVSRASARKKDKNKGTMDNGGTGQTYKNLLQRIHLFHIMGSKNENELN